MNKFLLFILLLLSLLKPSASFFCLCSEEIHELKKEVQALKQMFEECVPKVEAAAERGAEKGVHSVVEKYNLTKIDDIESTMKNMSLQVTEISNTTVNILNLTNSILEVMGIGFDDVLLRIGDVKLALLIGFSEVRSVIETKIPANSFIPLFAGSLFVFFSYGTRLWGPSAESWSDIRPSLLKSLGTGMFVRSSIALFPWAMPGTAEFTSMLIPGGYKWGDVANIAASSVFALIGYYNLNFMAFFSGPWRCVSEHFHSFTDPDYAEYRRAAKTFEKNKFCADCRVREFNPLLIEGGEPETESGSAASLIKNEVGESDSTEGAIPRIKAGVTGSNSTA